MFKANEISQSSFKKNTSIRQLASRIQPRTQALWFVYVIKRTWDGTRGGKMENSAGSAW
jgi:hypothetical protein